MSQPDFQKLFFEYFGNVPRKVGYSVRHDSNRYHDVVFLASLMHDARFRRSQATWRGNRLTISIHRDCWELRPLARDGTRDLCVARARVTLQPVLSVEWRTSHRNTCDDAELWISGVWLSHATDGETPEFWMEGEGWSCVVTLRDDDMRIRLADLEVPRPVSPREDT